MAHPIEITPGSHQIAVGAVGDWLYGGVVARARDTQSNRSAALDTGQQHPPAPAERKVEVRRSARRKRTVSAYLDGDVMVVLLPARMTKAEERHWVAEMERKLQRSELRRQSPARRSDEALLSRCAELSRRYLKGRASPVAVRWVPPMRTRWASCTPSEGTIRVSDRLREVPSWVLDYVLVHELAHLLVPGHNAEFWALCARYQKTERAIGYLEGLSAAAGLGITGLDGDAQDAEDV